MTVRGRTIYHCHGAKKGKVYRRYSSHKKALQVHRAMAKKK